MKARKVTLLMFLTVISLLTIFLVVLLDDSVLAAENPGCPKIKEVMENAAVSCKQGY